MDSAINFTRYETIKTFITLMAIVFITFLILTCCSTYPFKKLVFIIYKYPSLDPITYYFYYQKATAYRLLFSVHLIFDKLIKISNITSTFITLYCAVDNNDFILLFSMISAVSAAIALTIPSEMYSKLYVQAARKLEYILNNGTKFQEPELSIKLNEAYQEAESIIEKNFQ